MLKTAQPDAVQRRRFLPRHGEEMGPRLLINTAGRAQRPQRRQPGLGGAGQHLLLARPEEEGRRRHPDPAPALRRPARRWSCWPTSRAPSTRTAACRPRFGSSLRTGAGRNRSSGQLPAEERHGPSVLSAAKDLMPATRPVSDRSVRSFAALRTAMAVWGIPCVLPKPRANGRRSTTVQRARRAPIDRVPPAIPACRSFDAWTRLRRPSGRGDRRPTDHLAATRRRRACRRRPSRSLRTASPRDGS